MKVIPAIDLQNGRCVRLLQGDFTKQTEYSDDPASVALGFQQAGFNDLHIVDLDGALSGKQVHLDLVQSIVRRCGLEIQLGGGIRNYETVSAWLNLGVQRCVVGSVAVKDPIEVQNWIRSFGADHIVLALDVRIDEHGLPCLTTDGWTKDAAVSLWESLDDYCAAGVSHVLCTDISRDGAMTGPAISLYRRITERYPQIQLQASGGVRDVADLRELADLGVYAAITGRAMLDGMISKEELDACLQNG